MASSLRNRKFFLAFVFLVFGVIFFVWHFSKEKINSRSDLKSFSGKLYDYSFTECKGSKGRRYEYYLYLQNNHTTFQLPPDFVPYFYSGQFKSSVKTGDTVTFLLSPTEIASIEKKEQVNVFAIESKNIMYLNYNETIAKYNTKLIFIVGIVFFTLGVFFIFWALRK